MKILISGAGPAGLSLAYWLKSYGYTPTIIETAPTLRTGGYKIDIRGAALDVIRRMGIYEAVKRANTDMQGARLVDKSGKIISEMKGDAFGHRLRDDQEIMRGTLCQILLNQIPDVEIIFGAKIQTLVQTARDVTVTFKGNESRSFDLIIGADGLHSNVRRLVFGEESNFLKSFGIYLCVFTIPNYLHLDRMEMQYTEFGRLAALWSTRDDQSARATFAFVSDEKLEHHDIAAQQQLLRKTFKGIGWEVPKMLELMQQSSDFYFDVSAQVCMNHWSKDRVALTGDAAYCASPLSGQGLSLALVGPYVLAGELAKSKGDFKVAFKQYELEMRSFIQINQALGIQSAKIFRSQQKQNPLSWLFGKIMSVAPGILLKFLINRSTERIHNAANSIHLKNYSKR